MFSWGRSPKFKFKMNDVYDIGTSLVLLSFYMKHFYFDLICFTLYSNSRDLLQLMTDPASGHNISGDLLLIDTDQVLALGIDKHDQYCRWQHQRCGWRSHSSTNFDVDEEDDNGTSTRGHHRSHHKCQHADFPDHRHTIGFQVIHQDNAVSKNARYARNGFPPRQIRRDGKSYCPNNIRSLPCCHNHCQMQCHKQGSSKQYSRIVHLFFPSMCYKSIRMLSLITLFLAATSPCVLLVNHDSATLLKHSPLVATNLHQHMQSSGEQSNSSILPSPRSANS